MLLVQHFKYHIPWICLAVLAVTLGLFWHASASRELGRTVGGSSLVGLTLGTAAASIILFELLLWPRKRLRRYKLGQTKIWLAAHLWLGLATGPLAFIHAGFRFGGTFSTTLMILLLLVLVSGLYGWLLQTILPRWMLKNLPAETVASQIDHVSKQSVDDARSMLTIACGAPTDEASMAIQKAFNENLAGELEESKTIVIGATRKQGGLRGRTLVTTTVEVAPSDRDRVWRQYTGTVEPYLLRGDRISSVLGDPQKAPLWFAQLRESCSPSAEILFDRLEDLCEQRRQFDRQHRIHWWLHGWIALHAAMSVLLGILLVAHIVLALRFW